MIFRKNKISKYLCYCKTTPDICVISDKCGLKLQNDHTLHANYELVIMVQRKIYIFTYFHGLGIFVCYFFFFNKF
jgi:hypothetical protein